MGGEDSRQVAGLGRARAGQARRAQLRAVHKKTGFALLKPRNARGLKTSSVVANWIEKSSLAPVQARRRG